VISTPLHVQDVPARFSPVMGFEGANVLFDSWVHPLMMGLEEHLLQMFREDFEFHDGAQASHLAHSAPPRHTAPEPAAHGVPDPGHAAAGAPMQAAANEAANEPAPLQWSPEGERELRKIPFFVRNKARRNTERYAAERGVSPITVETLYEAKAHFGR
jgi:light-independent protochlorophyllide reductase subunit B